MTQSTTPDPKAMKAILDQANDQLDHSVDETSIEHEHFLNLLGELAQQRAAVMAEPASMGDKLAADLKAFEARLPKRYAEHWDTLVSDI
jgi:hypothetical protein